MDVFWIYHHPIERVFFYQLPRVLTSHFIESVLPDLNSSLSLTLRHFYLLAGRIRPRAEPVSGGSRHEIHYADGDSVSLTVVECTDEHFDGLSGSRPRKVARLRPLLPWLPRSADALPLLAIQLTLFRDNGAAISVALHHAACDGSSSAQFLSSWAACCRSGGSPVPALAPLFDRTLMPDPYRLYSVFVDNASARKAEMAAAEERSKEDAQEATSDVVIATFTFACDQIKRLREIASAKAAPGGAGASFHCSSITVAFAYVWVCLVKARGYEPERSCFLGFPNNGRNQLIPPAPAEYFRNCLVFCLVEATAGDLIGGDGFVVAAKAIGKSIEAFKNRPLQGACAVDEVPLEKRARAKSQQMLTVAGSPQFKVYDCDFGWGRPRKVEVPSIAGTGAVSAAESREGGGGLKIGFALRKHEMEEFTSHFNNGSITCSSDRSML